MAAGEPLLDKDNLPPMCHREKPWLPPKEEIRQVLDDRGKKYGPFIGHALITQELKERIAIHVSKTNVQLVADQQEALDMICHKIGRIVNGDPNYADSWVDIAGYAQLVADRLNGVSR